MTSWSRVSAILTFIVVGGETLNTLLSFTSIYIKMRNTYEENWVIFGQCKKCKNFFHMNEEFWYKSKSWFMWFSSLCKTCDNKWRWKRGKNYEVAREANKRYYEKNKKKIVQGNHKRGKAKWYDIIQSSTRKRIKRLWIRPDSCPICWRKDVRIIAHHPDYSNRFLIVFCCDSCHMNIHNWNIECPKPIEI